MTDEAEACDSGGHSYVSCEESFIAKVLSHMLAFVQKEKELLGTGAIPNDTTLAAMTTLWAEVVS